MIIKMTQEDFEARNVMREVEVDGHLEWEYVLELTPTELYEAYEEKECEYLNADIAAVLEFDLDMTKEEVEAITNNEDIMSRIRHYFGKRDTCAEIEELQAVIEDIIEEA